MIKDAAHEALICEALELLELFKLLNDSEDRHELLDLARELVANAKARATV